MPAARICDFINDTTGSIGRAIDKVPPNQNRHRLSLRIAVHFAMTALSFQIFEDIFGFSHEVCEEPVVLVPPDRAVLGPNRFGMCLFGGQRAALIFPTIQVLRLLTDGIHLCRFR
jgi:hypothetical protein